jgi:arabinofuranosyltransferase
VARARGSIYPGPAAALHGIVASPHTAAVAVVGAEAGPSEEQIESRPRERRLSESIRRLSLGRERPAEAVVLALGAALAWWFRFAQDDAFITYRFSRNLARGNGLVFNPGEKVEGYTNFLYAAIHAVPEKLGWTTPAFGQVLGVVLFVATLALVIRISERLFDSRPFALLVALVLIANVTFTRYATGGMETMLQVLCLMLVVWAVLGALRDGSALPTGRLLLAGLGAGLAILTRLDSVVFLAGLLAAVLYQQWKPTRSVSTPLRTLGIAGAVLVVVVGPWFAWKYSYYGNLLPNTFYAKSASGPLGPLLFAFSFLLTFFILYGAFLLIGRFRKYRKEFFAVPGVAALFVVVPVWMLYIVAVGADFMEYRFMVVLIPLLAMLAAFLLDRYVNALTEGALVGVLLLFSLGHNAPLVTNLPVMTFHNLDYWPAASPNSWTGLGRDLGRYFPGGPDVPGQPVIAVAPIGVIGYYSDLETIDMLGLTDAWVARNAPSVPIYYPGHVRSAPPDYLERRGVDLIFGFPEVLTTEEAAKHSSYRFSELFTLYPVADLRLLPEDTVVLEIPAGPGHVWRVLYTGHNDKVDRAIAERGWVVKPIDRVCDKADLNDFVKRNASKLTC